MLLPYGGVLNHLCPKSSHCFYASEGIFYNETKKMTKQNLLLGKCTTILHNAVALNNC